MPGPAGEIFRAASAAPTSGRRSGDVGWAARGTMQPVGAQAASDEVITILRRAKALAKRYRALTGRPLGITGEIAEYEAARLVRGVKLAGVRSTGYDATRVRGGRVERLQIKGRCMLPGCKPGTKLGRIDLAKPFDFVLLVLLDEDFEATAIYEATRRAVRAALTAPGSKARNERGALGVNKFRAIGRRIWAARAAA